RHMHALAPGLGSGAAALEAVAGHGRCGWPLRTGPGLGTRGRAMDYRGRRARTGDVRAIRRLIDANVASGRLLDKPTVTLYEDIQEFLVAERDSDGQVVGCGALHVMWEDLAEIRTIAVDDSCQGEGVGHLLVEALLARARELGVRRVFVLTFAVKFFGRLGFEEITGEAASPE